MTNRRLSPASGRHLSTSTDAPVPDINQPSSPSLMYHLTRSSSHSSATATHTHSQTSIDPSTVVPHNSPSPSSSSAAASAAATAAVSRTTSPAGGLSQRVRMHSSGKPCHNCRRRRLRCDRSWPSCHKCAVSGQECLGYGKVFIWTQGIDENGNVKPASSSRRNASSSVSYSIPPSTSSTPIQPLSAFQPPTSAASSLSLRPKNHGMVQPQFHHFLPSPTASPVVAPASESTANGASSSSSVGALTDPLFQDLDRTSRYYLAYCE